MSTTPNALVKIGRQTGHGYTEQWLDYEQIWEDGGEFVIKAYDADAQIVYIRINKTVAMEGMLGLDMSAHPPTPADTDGTD